MRGTFIRTLTKLARKDSRIILLTGDLGYMAIEPFANEFPDRFYNVGVAEQNMLGVATGLAEAGYIPFVYSIATFVSMRPYEFIRNGAILHKLPVRIVGIGGGFEYGLNGITHFSVEDIGIFRVQPSITLIAPSDYEQTRNALFASWDLDGPIYYRIGKDDTNSLSSLKGHFDFNKASLVRSGKDVLLATYGSIAFEVIKAAEMLEEIGVSCGVVVVAVLSPPPVQDLIDLLQKFSHVVTIEAHYTSGGIGSLVAEIIAESNLDARLLRCGICSLPSGISGSQDYMNEYFGISATKIFQSVKQAMDS